MTVTDEVRVPRWTGAEFERLVFAAHPRVAVFDCDGTLWSGDAGYGFMSWSIEQGLVSRSTSDWLDERYRAYRAGGVSENEICGEVVQIYAGLRDQELRAAAAEYVREFVRDRYFPEMVSLMAALRGAGVELWAVSSTNKWIIVEGVRDFGIPEERVLAVEVRVEGGIIGNEIVDLPTGEGKAKVAAPRGPAGARRGLRQLDSRPGDAGDGAPPLPGEPLAGVAGSGGAARLGLLPAAGGRWRFGCRWGRVSRTRVRGVRRILPCF